METCQQQNNQDQDKWETDQHFYHPVLCPNKINDSDIDAKDKFYEQLQVELENTPGHDLKIVMGDLKVTI